MTIEEAFTELENYIDASDPDLDLVRPLFSRSFHRCILSVAPNDDNTFNHFLYFHFKAKSTSPSSNCRGHTQG